MGFFCMNEDGRYRVALKERLPHMEFVLDSNSEVRDLPNNESAVTIDGVSVGPCAPGSVALVPATSCIFMMNGLGDWKLFSNGGVGTWTEDEREEFVQEVIAALGKTAFGSVDDDKKIKLDRSLLEAGKNYTVGYEDASGNFVVIGDIPN